MGAVNDIKIKIKIRTRLTELYELHGQSVEAKSEAEITENTTKAKNCQREISIYKAKIQEVEAILRLFNGQ